MPLGRSDLKITSRGQSAYAGARLGVIGPHWSVAPAGWASSSGDSQRNAVRSRPWNEHSAAMFLRTLFFLVADFDAAAGADAATAPDAAVAEACAALVPAATAEAAAASEAGTGWNCPSTTTRDPWIPAPVCWISRCCTDDSPADLSRIICSHASEFLYTAVQPADTRATAVAHAIDRVRIFIDFPLFRPSAIVAYGSNGGSRVTRLLQLYAGPIAAPPWTVFPHAGPAKTTPCATPPRPRQALVHDVCSLNSCATIVATTAAPRAAGTGHRSDAPHPCPVPCG